MVKKITCRIDNGDEDFWDYEDEDEDEDYKDDEDYEDYKDEEDEDNDIDVKETWRTDNAGYED